MVDRLILRRWMAVMLLAITTGCGFFGSTSCDAIDEQSGFPMYIILDLPAEAQVQSESCLTGLNPTYNAVFTMPAGSLAAFQASTRISEWTTTGARHYEEAAASATSYLYGDYGDGAIYETALVDTSNPDLYTVYYTNSFVD